MSVLQDMTWPEVERLLGQTDVALVPVASIEEHGPHLPLSTDVDIARGIASRVATAMEERGRPVVVAPAIPFGLAENLMAFPGTITVTAELLKATIEAIGRSLQRHGIRNLLLLPGHILNLPAMQLAAEDLARDADMKVVVANWLLPLREHDPDIFAGKSTQPGGHAGEGETSLMLALRPEVVHLARLSGSAPTATPATGGWASPKAAMSYPPYSGGAVDVSGGDFRRGFPQGYMGDPTLASVEAGQRRLAVATDWLCTVLDDQFPKTS